MKRLVCSIAVALRAHELKQAKLEAAAKEGGGK